MIERKNRKTITTTSTIVDKLVNGVDFTNTFHNPYFNEDITKTDTFNLVCYKEKGKGVSFANGEYTKDYNFDRYNCIIEVVYDGNPFGSDIITSNYIEQFIGDEGFALYSPVTNGLRVYRHNYDDLENQLAYYDLLEIECIVSRQSDDDAGHIEGINYRYCEVSLDMVFITIISLTKKQMEVFIQP